MANELTKEEKKALRKEKFKKILKIIGIAAGSAAVAGVAAYAYGKKEGYKNGEEVGIAEAKLTNDICANDAIDAYRDNLVEYVMHGNFASKLTNIETGEVKYLTYNLSDEKPEWWDKCEIFDLKEEVVDELNQ